MNKQNLMLVGVLVTTALVYMMYKQSQAPAATTAA
jgi:hypothetical protein